MLRSIYPVVFVDDDPADVSNPSLHGATTWTAKAQRLRTEAHVFYLVFKHLRTPWYARVVAACSVGYIFSPVQLIPNFIPVIGFLDDFLVLHLGAKLLWNLTPPDVLAECRESAHVRRGEGITPPTNGRRKGAQLGRTDDSPEREPSQTLVQLTTNSLRRGAVLEHARQSTETYQNGLPNHEYCHPIDTF